MKCQKWNVSVDSNFSDVNEDVKAVYPDKGKCIVGIVMELELREFIHLWSNPRPNDRPLFSPEGYK